MNKKPSTNTCANCKDKNLQHDEGHCTDCVSVNANGFKNWAAKSKTKMFKWVTGQRTRKGIIQIPHKMDLAYTAQHCPNLPVRKDFCEGACTQSCTLVPAEYAMTQMES